ncbi:MAG TPA: ASCH domain-containing protein [Symbiobacteriaceae bacterium]
MIFKPEHITLIKASAKTQTRRLGDKRWIEGHSHTVKASWFGPEECRVEIMYVYQARLGSLSEDDARKEGYASVNSYKAAWERIYKARWDDELLVWVVEFRLVVQLQQTTLPV